MAPCGRQVCRRFLAKASSAWHPVAGKCAEDFWQRPPRHGTLWQASVPKIFGRGPLDMAPCCRQVCLRFLAEAPSAWHPAAGKCAEDFWPRPPWHGTLQQASVPKIFGQGPLGMAVCAEDFWPRPPWHGTLQQASVPKIFGQGPLSMAPCGGQVCRRLLAESPWAQHPAACN